MVAEDAIRAFEDAVRKRGIIPPPGGIVADGKIKRCAVEGTPHKKDAAYILFPDHPISGGYQNWRDGKGWENWISGNSDGNGLRLTAEEVRAAKARQEKINQARGQERADRQTEAAADARKIWEAAKPAPPDHPYLAKKKIGAHDIRIDASMRLLIPMQDSTGDLWNLQRIDQAGEKRFKSGGRTEGIFFTVGPVPEEIVVIVEGASTALSIFEATGLSTVAAMSAGNLLAAGKAIREKLPKVRLIYFADHDHPNDGVNVGVSKATEAAKATGGIVAMSPMVGDDANDLYAREGAEAVRAAIDAAMGTGTEKTGPEPLCYETLNPISLSDLILSDLPDPEPLIEGILYPETVLVIGALVKMHKTWVALQLALSGVCATAFLGHAIRRKIRVIYIGGEGSDRTIKKRFMTAMGYIPGLQDGDCDNLGVVSSQGRVKLDTPAGEEWLQRVSEGYDVVIIDPYYRFLSVGSENDHADQRAIQDVFDRLKAKGKAIVIVHHLRKPQKDVNAGAAELRGAGLDAFADTILLLSRANNHGEKRFTLKYILRHDEEPDNLELSLNGPLLQVATPLPLKVTTEDLIAAIDAAGGTITGTALVRNVRDVTEGSKNEVEKVLATAIKAKVIGWRRKEGKGQGRLYYVNTRPEDAV